MIRTQKEQQKNRGTGAISRSRTAKVEGTGDNALCYLIKGKGSIRYSDKSGIEHLVRIDYHGSKEVPTGTCHAILRAAGLKHREE